MKAGARALGIAESTRGERSTLAGAVVRASRVVDDVVFDSCTVGGTDATDSVCALWERLAREDVQYVLLAGIAPAWYNILDLHRIADDTDRPVLSVSFETSDGLGPSIEAEFDGDAATTRLETYRAQPDRHRVDLEDDTVYVRSVGLDPDRATEVVRNFTPEGGRPEPLRIARLAARAADSFRHEHEPPADG